MWPTQPYQGTFFEEGETLWICVLVGAIVLLCGGSSVVVGKLIAIFSL